MRNFVNVALVPCFLTLVITGILRYLLPFSLITTRVHIVFGAAVLVLVALHIASRTGYFVQVIRRAGSWTKGRSVVSTSTLGAVLVVWLTLLGTALWDLPPVSAIIDLSYEERHRAEIFRPDPNTVYQPIDDGLRVKRATEGTGDLLVQVDWGPAFPDDYAGENGDPGDGPRPQVAIWTEGETGSLIETLFLSEQAAFGESFSWAEGTQRRGDVLPVWRHRYTLKTGIAPDGDEVAYSGATPEHSFSIHTHLHAEGDPFYLYLEVNAPADTNGYYRPHRDTTHPGYVRRGLGQPSILYGARVEPTAEDQYLLLDLVGHGGSRGTRDGNMNYDTEHLSTARDLVEKVLVRVRSGEPPADSTETSDPS